MRRVAILSLLLALVCAHASPGVSVQQRPEVFRLEGAVEKPSEWTNARVEKEFAGDLKTVSYTLKGEKGEAKCVPLFALIQAAKPRLNSKVKNHLLAFVAVVQAEDGYTIAFSLGELSPQIGKRAVWLALNRNGKPLPEDETPVSLIVPDDEKPARWAHGVTRITLIDGFEIAGKMQKK